MKTPSPKITIPILVFGLFVLASLACGQSTTSKLQEARSPESSIDESQPDLAVLAATATPAPVQPADGEAQPTQASVSESMTAAEPLRIAGQGFGQDGRAVGFAFLIENPNANAAIEDSRYQVAFFASDGTVVATESGYVEVVFPGQRLGIGGGAYVDEGVSVARIEAQVSTGDAVVSERLPEFGLEAVTYQAGEYFSYATGSMRNPFDRDISNLRVSAVVYDAENNIIGGGFTYANFILANSARGVEVSVTSLPSVTRVEIYAALSGLSAMSAPSALPAGASGLDLLRHGFGQDETHLAYGMILRNPNGSFSVERSQYHVSAYAADGTVLGVEEGYIELVLPGQTLGIAGDAFLSRSEPVARLDVQLQTNDLVTSDVLPGFTAENIAYMPGDYTSSVTGQIANPYARDITNLRVNAILYDSGGNIIGGGFAYLDFVPANGRSAVDVSVMSSAAPTVAELYAAVSGLSDIR